MLLDAVHITNKFAQHGDTLITSVTNMPEQIDVRVTDFPESISLAKDVSALRDSIDSISTHITDIFNQGVGFTDDIQIFVIPALVSVFAFVIPFIFQVTSQIDEKYESRDFRTMFFCDWKFIIFGVLLLVNLILDSYYIVMRCYYNQYFTDSLIPCWMFALMLALFIWLVVILWYSLSYNDPHRLFAMKRRKCLGNPFMKKAYYKSLKVSQIQGDTSSQEIDNRSKEKESPRKMKYTSLITLQRSGLYKSFYFSIERLTQYAIKHDNELLDDIVTYMITGMSYIRKLQKTEQEPFGDTIYPIELVSSITSIVFDYSKKEDNFLVNDRMAYLLYGFFDDTYSTSIQQNILDALMYAMTKLQQNGHVSAINRFEHLTRHHYANLIRVYLDKKGKNKITKEEQLARENDIKNIRHMMILFNARLFDLGQIDCVNDAIVNNYDDFGTNSAIMPMDEFDALEEYFELQNEGNKFHGYASIFSPDGLPWDYTLISQSLTKLFGYLLVRLYKSEYPLRKIPVALLKTNHELFINYFQQLEKISLQFDVNVWKYNVDKTPNIQTIYNDLRSQIFGLCCEISNESKVEEAIRERYKMLLNKDSVENSVAGVIDIASKISSTSIKLTKWTIAENKLALLDANFWCIQKLNDVTSITNRIYFELSKVYYERLRRVERNMPFADVDAYLDQLHRNGAQYKLVYTGIGNPSKKYEVVNGGIPFVNMFGDKTLLLVNQKVAPKLYVRNSPVVISDLGLDIPPISPKKEDNHWSLPQCLLQFEPQIWINYNSRAVLHVIHIV